MWPRSSGTPSDLYLRCLRSAAVAAPELLPWVAIRAGIPLSPMGQGRFEGDLKVTVRSGLREFGKLLVWDLDGMERGNPQLDLYRQFEGKGLWVDAGVRNIDGLIDVLVAGADIAVINLRILPRLDLLEEAAEMTDRLSLCVEESQGVLAADPRARGARAVDLFKQAAGLGIPKGIYLSYEVVKAEPDWVKSVEGMTLFAGPAGRSVTPEAPPVWNAVVDLMEKV